MIKSIKLRKFFKKKLKMLGKEDILYRMFRLTLQKIHILKYFIWKETYDDVHKLGHIFKSYHKCTLDNSCKT